MTVTVCELEHGPVEPVEIVDLPAQNGGSFHSFSFTFTRVLHAVIFHFYNMIRLKGCQGLLGLLWNVPHSTAGWCWPQDSIHTCCRTSQDIYPYIPGTHISCLVLRTNTTMGRPHVWWDKDLQLKIYRMYIKDASALFVFGHLYWHVDTHGKYSPAIQSWRASSTSLHLQKPGIDSYPLVN